MTYAFTRSRSALDGDVRMDPRTGSWQAASSPALEMVLNTLRTPLGGCLATPDLGVDWSKVDTLRTDAAATGRAVILAGLQPLVSTGWITDVRAEVTVDARRGLLGYTVTFVDPRLKKTLTAQGTI